MPLIDLFDDVEALSFSCGSIRADYVFLKLLHSSLSQVNSVLVHGFRQLDKALSNGLPDC